MEPKAKFNLMLNGVPADVLDELDRRADAHFRSRTGEILSILTVVCRNKIDLAALVIGNGEATAVYRTPKDVVEFIMSNPEMRKIVADLCNGKTTADGDGGKGDTVARVKAELSPGAPCVHVGPDGYCQGPCEGAICCKCADYRPRAAEAAQDGPQSTGDGQGGE